jgi:hypothetical protein
MRTVAALLCFALVMQPGHARAQGRQIFTMLVKMGQSVVNVLVERRTDLALHILGATIVEVGRSQIESLFPRGQSSQSAAGSVPPRCAKIADDVGACSNRIDISGARNTTKSELAGAEAKIRATTTLIPPEPSQSTPSPPRSEVPLQPPDQPVQSPPATPRLRVETFPPPDQPANPRPEATLPRPDQLVRSAPATPDSQLTNDTNRLEDLVFWWSVQASQYAPDLQDYLIRFPDGQFRSLAERRLAAIPPSPRPPTSYCRDSDFDVLEPIRALYRAINLRDISAYSSQWFEFAVYRSYDNRIIQNKAQKIAGRRRAFASWRSAQIDLLDWRVSHRSQENVVVRNTYQMTIVFTSGRRYFEQELESYTLGCADDGKWKIIENIDYLPPAP